MACKRTQVLNAMSEIKGSDPKYVWEIVGIYRAPNEDIRATEELAARTGFSMKQYCRRRPKSAPSRLEGGRGRHS
jgi:hypothetical protein